MLPLRVATRRGRGERWDKCAKRLMSEFGLEGPFEIVDSCFAQQREGVHTLVRVTGFPEELSYSFTGDLPARPRAPPLEIDFTVDDTPHTVEHVCTTVRALGYAWRNGACAAGFPGWACLVAAIFCEDFAKEAPLPASVNRVEALRVLKDRYPLLRDLVI